MGYTIGNSALQRRQIVKPDILAYIQGIPNDIHGIARTLKNVRTTRGYYNIRHRFTTIMSLFKLALLLKERICYQRERILSFKSSS